MPTRKITEIKGYGKVCLSPEHKIPSHLVFTPGVWEHTCPACGRVMRFTVKPKPEFAV